MPVALALATPKTLDNVQGHAYPPPAPHALPVLLSTPVAKVAQPSVLPVMVKLEPEGTTILPALSIVVVAVPPKYDFVNADRSEVEALSILATPARVTEKYTAPVDDATSNMLPVVEAVLVVNIAPPYSSCTLNAVGEVVDITSDPLNVEVAPSPKIVVVDVFPI